jgi:hypothetical protein
MSDLALLDSRYGLQPAIHVAAERIRAFGIRVPTPDRCRGRASGSEGDGRTGPPPAGGG